MPRILRTPEGILRETKADMVFVRFANGMEAHRRGKELAGKKELEDWLQTNLPGTRLELIGPSEFSGILFGGIGGDYAFWFASEAEVSQFSKFWEDGNGHSLDPRWQCFWYPIEEFQRRLDKFGDPRSWEV